MPFPGGNFVGFEEGKSSTPVSGNQTADYWADSIGSSNSSTLLPGFDNQTADSGTDLYGSREKYWIPIIIVIVFILTVSLIVLIFFFRIGPKLRRRFGMQNGNVPAVQFKPVAHNQSD